MKKIKANNYSIFIGKESLSKLIISDYSQTAILVDENTKKYCLPIFLENNKKFEEAKIIEIKSGEVNKNISTCNYIWEQLSKYCFDRDAVLINLGGGVIGDIGGYCASTYKRGINFIQIPTTLLAMVDASIGGKLAVNLKSIKNQIGLFNNPQYVLIYPNFLATLNNTHLKSGFAEILKHTLIANKEKWELLKMNTLENLCMEDTIYDSVNIKNNITLSDPLEKGNRKKLNFGHTFGHAIESYYLEKGTPITHGNAVFMGILLESEMSNLSQIEKIEIKNYILSNFNLPHIPQKAALIKYMQNDKKNLSEKINFSLLNGIGQCTINNLFFKNEL